MSILLIGLINLGNNLNLVRLSNFHNSLIGFQVFSTHKMRLLQHCGTKGEQKTLFKIVEGKLICMND